MSFLDSFQRHRKIPNDGNHPILRNTNTFNRQSTKPIQDSILCVSNFHMYMLSNVDATIQAFLCRAKPDPIVLHSYITFSSVCNWKQTFPKAECSFFVITSLFFLFFLGMGGVKSKIRCSKFYEFYLLEKP